MPGSSTRLSSPQFLDALDRELQAHPVHTNQFFEAFQLYNLSDKDEAIGLELMRVLYSEYGQGVQEDVHAAQMLRLVDRLGIDRGTLARERLCPEAQDYIDTVGEIFLRGDLPSALGASFGIETTAGLTYRYLHSGLLTFPDLSREDIRFFETHLVEELRHGDWLRTAVAGYADLDEQREKIRAAALLAMEKWHGLWQGMYRTVLSTTPLHGS